MWPAVVGLGLGLLALGPALARGFVLSYDMVFVPDPPIGAADLGLTGELARAVPSDLIVALVDRIIPAELVQKLILLAIFVLACSGAAALLAAGWRSRTGGTAVPLLPRLVAGVCYTWNPFVAERLIMGQWAMLLGYAALPWVLRELTRRPGPVPRTVPVGRGAMPPGLTSEVCEERRRHREAPRQRGAPGHRGVGGAPRLAGCPPGLALLALLPALVGGFAAMSITAVGAVPVAVCGERGIGQSHRLRRVAVTLGMLAVASLPWVIPSLIMPVHADQSGAAAFAARADTPFGTAGSLLMLGGIWNAQAVPAGYGGLASACWLLVVVAAIFGYIVVARPRRVCPGLGVAAMIGFCFAALGAWAPTLSALESAISVWPGFALLRDGQQFIAPLALAESIGLGAGVAALIAVARTSSPRLAGRRDADAAAKDEPAAGIAVVIGVFALVASVVLLPGLAWGAVGRLQAVRYPADWMTARRMIDTGQPRGSVLLLPWAQYRRYPWNNGEPLFDPWPRLLTRSIIWNDSLQVGSTKIAAESGAARRLGPVITSVRSLTAPMRAAGVRYVIVDAGPILGRPRSQLAELARLPGAQVVLASPDLIVFRLPG